MEVGWIESHNAGGLEGPDARDRWGREQQRHLAEVLARLVGRELLVVAADVLVECETTFEETEERGSLAFEDQPFVLVQPHVRGAARRGTRARWGECERTAECA